MTLGLPSCAGDQAMNLVKSSQPNVFRAPRMIYAMVIACLFCTIAAQGNLFESLNGFSLPASPVNLALNPSLRLGFVYGGTTLQSFTY